MDNTSIATKWRQHHGYIGKGGVVVIHEGTVNSWVNELRDPGHWVPGCIAVDEQGNQWESVGGDDCGGSDHWAPITRGK